MENKDRYVTPLDILGIQRALQERCLLLEGGFSMARDRTLPDTVASLESFEDLVRRDKEREKDGLPRRIRWSKTLVAPGKVITIPYVEEEKLVHGRFEPENIKKVSAYGMPPHARMSGGGVQLNEPDIDEDTGSGKGEVGDVIGEVPIGRGSGVGDDGDDGDGDDDGPPGSGAGDQSDGHLEEEAYDLGKRLTERLQLPNLREKIKKFPTDEYAYDLTDRHHGSGQVLDRKETLRQIVKANLALGRINKDHLDPSRMVVGPEQRVYRVLSRERVWKSQAAVFFARDYSGSMYGDPTSALRSQHLMIYAWLLVQYEKRVVPRFFVHDTEAREVTAQQYFALGSWGGGTYIPSVYKEITKTIEGEGLGAEYNIYLFQGTDGDDGDMEGEEAIPEIHKIFGYVNRMGVTIFKYPYYGDQKTVFEAYVEKGGILERRDIFRMHIMPQYYNVTDEMNVEALKALIAQD